MKFVVSFLLFPVYYFFLLIILWIVFGKLLPVILLLLAFFLTGVLGFRYYISWKKFIGKWRFRQNLRTRPPEFTELSRLRSELIIMLDSLVEKYKPGTGKGQ